MLSPVSSKRNWGCYRKSKDGYNFNSEILSLRCSVLGRSGNFITFTRLSIKKHMLFTKTKRTKKGTKTLQTSFHYFEFVWMKRNLCYLNNE